jgi:hypothetical protein
MGIVKVKTVAIAAMAALTIVSVLTLIESIRKSSIGILHPYEAHGFFQNRYPHFRIMR